MKKNKLIALISVIVILTSITVLNTDDEVISYEREVIEVGSPSTPDITLEPTEIIEVIEEEEVLEDLIEETLETPEVVEELPIIEVPINTQTPEVTPTNPPVTTPSAIIEEPVLNEEEEQILKLVALTFDDGPGPYTIDLIDALNEYDARATFFVVGNRLEKHEDELNYIASSGNEIAIHTYSHKSFTSLGSEGTIEELKRTKEILENMKLAYSNLIRPPYGSLNSNIKNSIENPFILWNIDTRDWESKDAIKVRDAILNGIEEGNIILLHDIHKSTVEGVKLALPLIPDGYKFVSVSELALNNGYNLENGNAYYSLKK